MRMVRASSLVCALLLLSAPAPRVARAASRPESTWVDHYRAALAAHRAGDIPGFRAQLLVVGGVLGDQPGVNYNLACAAARLGDRDEALRRLRLYAASGLVRDVAADSDFVSLWSDGAFQEIAARIRANRDSVGTAREIHRFAHADLLTEDLAYDPVSRSYFASTVHRGVVVEVQADGREREWTDASARPGWGVFAACVDAKRRLLWTSVGATPTTTGYVPSDSGRTGLVAWDLRTRTVARRIDWPVDGQPHLLGDLTVAPDGTVYASDSPAGALREVRPGSDRLVTRIPSGLEGPQTPAMSGDGRRLYVASYSRGIAVVDPRSGRYSWMTFAPGVGLQGIDGLYVLGHDLIAVQNGTRPVRVMRFHLDAAGTRVVGGEPIERGTQRLGEPTHGVVVGGKFCFLANTGWDRVGDDQVMKEGAGDPPRILEADLVNLLIR